MARPAWKPTAKERETVKKMTGYGIPQHEIAATLRITKPTLEKHCRAELDTGTADANTKVAASMFRMATKGPYSVRFSAAKYWLACRAGWRETSVVEVLKLPSQMNEEELIDLVARTKADIAERDAAYAGGGSTTVIPFRQPPWPAV
jgi:hypothetical protein